VAKPGDWWLTVDDRLICGPGFDFQNLVEVEGDRLLVRSGSDPEHPIEIPLDKLNEMLKRKPSA